MKIAYLTHDDPNDVHAWSGCTFEMGECLKRQEIEVTKLGPLSPPPGSLLTKLRWHAYRKIIRKDYWPERDPAVTRHYAQQAASLLQAHAPDADVVLSPGTIPIGQLQCRQPIVSWTDATFACMLNFYPNASNLSRRTLRGGHALEQSALDRCRLSIYSSQWAADSAIRDYGIHPDKVKIVSLGANLRGFASNDEAEKAVQSRPTDRCRLISVGVDWVRKGINIAVEVASRLNAAGVAAELTIVGCQPPAELHLPPFVHIIPFISKATHDGRARLQQLLSESHFLLLPTQADATPVVFAEANGRAVPCLTTNVGGIPSVIRDGINGQKFSASSSPQVYADFIQEMMAQPGRYQSLCRTTFDEYQNRLNWDRSGQAVIELLEQVLRR